MWQQIRSAADTIAVLEIAVHLLEAALEGWALQLVVALVIGLYLGRARRTERPAAHHGKGKGKRPRR